MSPHFWLQLLSRIYAVGASTREPQRRDGRREESQREAANGNHHVVPCLRVAETGMSLRRSRLCGLIGLRSTAWLRLSAGAPYEEILEDYPDLEHDDILAAIEYMVHQTDYLVLPGV
jgi:hypothetical protein